ncbi:GGDEF domain-containing protein [Anaerobacillus alkaliphilus]|uniref:GGDEF domain-containing protein n=1 Tax=Anaerobacillus alkaliphilus TaxID=1548597 RepID=A0A4V1LGV7_9BACI|nr:GGDEF domain-containing protein [Anaerobacillus alkaliphilus]RXJ04075.1 GGDEF domain-containing protein [Anaerobacillus alkaliphilus]
MTTSIDKKEKIVMTILAVLQSNLYFWVVLYFWGTSNGSWLLGLFIFLSIFNLVTIKYIKRYPFIIHMTQLLVAFFIIYFSGNVESPFYPMYYLPVISSVAILAQSFYNRSLFILALSASILTFVNIYSMSTVTFLQMIQGGVYSLTYFALGYSVLFYQERLKETIGNSKIDYLTEVLNRNGGEAALLEEITKAKQGSLPLSIAFCDLDNFKQLNDRYGHLSGDMILKTTASIIKETIPKDSYVVRWGGEEFLLILKGIPKDNAFEIFEHIRTKIELHSFNVKGSTLSITISGGIVEASEYNYELVEILSEADQLLYKAKDLGRNKIFSN